MTDLAEQFSEVQRGDTVVLSGYPDDDESEWHVNTAAQIGEGSGKRKAIILQAADVSENWLTVALSWGNDSNWRIEDVAAFEGEPPSGAGDKAAISIGVDDIEFISL